MDVNLDARERLVILITAMVLLLFSAGLSGAAEKKTIVVFGDSLVAGYGLPPGEAFPEKLAVALKDRGHDIKIVNAGVSGDTTTGGLARLDWSIGEEADAVILELGANDALRGIPPDITRKNLDTMMQRLTDRGLPVVIAGMLAPPNMGKKYEDQFNSIYGELAKTYDQILYPFFLDGVAANPELNQSDGIHPNSEGISVMIKKFLPTAENLIAKISG